MCMVYYMYTDLIFFTVIAIFTLILIKKHKCLSKEVVMKLMVFVLCHGNDEKLTGIFAFNNIHT